VAVPVAASAADRVEGPSSRYIRCVKRQEIQPDVERVGITFSIASTTARRMAIFRLRFSESTGHWQASDHSEEEVLPTTGRSTCNSDSRFEETIMITFVILFLLAASGNAPTAVASTPSN